MTERIFGFVDRIGSVDGPAQIRVRARLRALTTEEGGRKGPFWGAYRPNHNFEGPDGREFYVGQIDVPNGGKVHPGETCEVVVCFINGPGLEERLQVGRTWRIQEGPHLVAIADVLERLPDEN